MPDALTETGRPIMGDRERDLPRVSCVVISWNRVASVAACVWSLLASDYPEDRVDVLVADNASTDGTVDQLRAAFRSEPRVRIASTGGNFLTSGAVNFGLSSAAGEFVFVLADDNRVDRECLRRLVRGARAWNAGIAAPKMYYGVGSDRRVFSYGAKASRYGLPARNPGAGQIDRGQFERDWFPGAVHNALLIRRDVVATIGGFDVGNFPMHNEEADFCERARQRGFRIVTIGTAVLWHNVDPNGEVIRVGTRDFSLDSPVRAYLNARNRTMYVRIHGTFMHQVIYFAAVFPIMTAAYVVLLLLTRSYHRSLSAYAHGLWDGINDSILPGPAVIDGSLPVCHTRWTWLYAGRGRFLG